MRVTTPANHMEVETSKSTSTAKESRGITDCGSAFRSFRIRNATQMIHSPQRMNHLRQNFVKLKPQTSPRKIKAHKETIDSQRSMSFIPTQSILAKGVPNSSVSSFSYSLITKYVQITDSILQVLPYIKNNLFHSAPNTINF